MPNHSGIGWCLTAAVSVFLGFDRPPSFYHLPSVADSKVVAVQKVPVPPLSAMGLVRSADFERMQTAGITYLDTFFIRADLTGDESLHFHELVHVVQWRILGPERFLWLYADVLERFGYRNSPLEVNRVWFAGPVRRRMQAVRCKSRSAAAASSHGVKWRLAPICIKDSSPVSQRRIRHSLPQRQPRHPPLPQRRAGVSRTARTHCCCRDCLPWRSSPAPGHSP